MLRATKQWLFLPMVLASAPALANPGAWTLQEGSWQIIHNLSYYHSDTRFNAFGQKITQPTYTKREYNPYIEYGLFDHTTIGANLFLQTASSQGEQNAGLADTELFVRSRLYKLNPKWKQSELVFSIQPLVKLPGLFDGNDQPKIGSDDADLALSLFAGHSFNYFKQVTFSEIELQYRHRLGTPNDQVKINYTLGQAIDHQWHLLMQSFNTISTNTVRGAAFTQTSQDDSDVTKLQLSGVYHYNQNVSFQAGAFMDVYGRNTGQGKGVLLSVWQRF